ncbi:MAG: lysoplasmalogenase [Rubrivivax sp.]
MAPLLLAAAATGALAIASGPLGQPGLFFVFKPLTTLLIIAWAWRRGHDTPAPRRWVLLGLVCSLAGDIALLWPQQGFLPGLVNFLLAHLAYLVAFTRQPGGRPLAATRLPFVAYAAVAGLILSQLWPGVPMALRGPVVAYVVCLVGMAAQAAVLGLARQPRSALLALGGVLFVASDTLLAVNKFATPLPLANLWILASYWPAQACIAAWLSPASPTSPTSQTRG